MSFINQYFIDIVAKGMSNREGINYILSFHVFIIMFKVFKLIF